MTVTVKGTLDGRDVDAQRTDAGEITGDRQLIVTAADRVRHCDVVTPGHPWPGVQASLTTGPLEFAVTIGSVLDTASMVIDGIDPPMDAEPDDEGDEVIY